MLAKQNWSQGRKRNAVHAYSSFLKMIGGTWKPPRYRRIPKIPWIPLEKEVDQLIAGSSHRIATFLQLLKETGMRPGEAWKLQLTDIDYENNSVRIEPEKGSNPRILKLSNKLVSMLKKLPKKNEYLFNNGLLDHFAQNFRQQRKRIAFKLENPRIERISFKTFRHFKGTVEYQKTKDLLHVKYVLGHKNIKNTLVYTHLVDHGEDDYITKVARDAKGACALLESGFEYVLTSTDDLMIFKKRK